MTIAALTWPEAVVGAVSVAALGLVLAVLIWSIFRTGQTAIRNEADGFGSMTFGAPASRTWKPRTP